jgi:Helix-turn-helix domain
MTIEQAQQLPPVITVEEARRVLGVGRSAAYAAAGRQEIPTLRFGRRLMVPTGQLLMLGLEPARQDAGT